jgi:formylglycine-generating enzyme required for sulfatase activity
MSSPRFALAAKENCNMIVVCWRVLAPCLIVLNVVWSFGCNQATQPSSGASSDRVPRPNLRLENSPDIPQPDKDFRPAEPPKPKDGPLGMRFIPLPKGTFYMGGGSGGLVGKKTEIPGDFEIAIYTVTQGQWQQIMDNNPSWCSRDGKDWAKTKGIKEEELKQFPVEGVSWNDTQDFLKKLNEKEKSKGYLYRLPTEAEWEYACRAGATTEGACSFDFYLEKPTNDLSSKQANFNGHYPCGKGEEGPYLNRPTKVGSYAPNQLGLYDMHGNVWQWTDTADGGGRVFRGGGCGSIGANCTASQRYMNPRGVSSGDVGFRIARVPVQ